MSLIEQAAKRLEELRRAGAETADVAAPSAVPENKAAVVAPRPEPTPEAAMSNLAVRMSSLAGLAAVESERVAATAKHATGPAVRPEPPPKLEIDLERLRSRGQDSSAAIQRRLSVAKQEIAQWKHFDYLILSQTVSQDLQRMQAILTAERLRNFRVQAPTLD